MLAAAEANAMLVTERGRSVGSTATAHRSQGSKYLVHVRTGEFIDIYMQLVLRRDHATPLKKLLATMYVTL